MGNYVIGVVGNPNCGKTTLFNALSGARQSVGNWPGVTVERKVGKYTHFDNNIEVIDLPGIYSIFATSLDEKVARDYILSGEADLIVNIIDASNIERNLYLTSQLVEMQVPIVLVLNMMDIVEKNKMDIDISLLSKRLGCPVIPIVASCGKGIEKLKEEINLSVKIKPVSNLKVEYPKAIQDAVEEMIPLVEKTALKNNINERYAVLRMLEGDEWFVDNAGKEAREKSRQKREEIESKLGEEIDILLADSRYTLINKLIQKAVSKRRRISKTLSDKIDKIVLNRAFGIPVFLLAMYLTFMITINIGGAFIDFFDIFAGTIFVDGFGELLSKIGTPQWLNVILAGGVGGSIQTIATFIPPIAFMFLCLCFLEDSGYMARAAFVMDRVMRIIGLPGKAFVPMLVGFGCNVPAIMATRTLENQRDRTLAIMMNPFVSCGARLPVYALFAAAFFPTGGQNLVFGLYLLGICFAALTGFILKNTLLKGDVTPFVMELPPYHMPTFKNVFMRAGDRLKTFIFKAGKLIIPVVVILSFLNSMGTDGSFGNEDSNKSVLSSIGKSITPAFTPMGITEENWPATMGIFTGIFAKEAVVGTLDSIYAQIGTAKEVASGDEDEPFDFWAGIGESVSTIPENLMGVADTLFDPLGISIGDVDNIESAAEEQEVAVGTFGAMVNLFDGKVGAFAYLLFILLYFPCVAAIAAVYRETNLNWTIFAGTWTTAIAYMTSVLFYQTATFSQHPLPSFMWIVALSAIFISAICVMRQIGNKTEKLIGAPIGI